MGASLIVGGVDLTGPQLYGVHPHGSYSRLPFTALGECFCPFPTNFPPCEPGLTFVPGWGAAADFTQMPLPPPGSGQDAALAVLEDRFQSNMTVRDLCTPLHGPWWEVHPGPEGTQRELGPV